jgi:hypothetical protein
VKVPGFAAAATLPAGVVAPAITRVSGPGWVMTGHPAHGQGADVTVEAAAQRTA